MSEAAEDPVITRRLDMLVDRCKRDHVLAGQMLPFIESATWSHDGEGTVTGRLALKGAPVMVLEVSKTMLVYGREDFPERKRVPL